MFNKRKLTFYVNGVKQSMKLRLITEGKLIGPGKWKSYNCYGKTTIFTTYDQSNELIEQHILDSHGKEIIEDKSEDQKKSENIEKKCNELGKVIYEKNTATGSEVWHEYDETGFEYHRKLSTGFEHFYTPDQAGNISGIKIVDSSTGKVISDSIEYWSDDRRYKIRITENFENNETQYFVHEYFRTKDGILVKERLYC